jgi:hypothetical protein
MTTRISHLLGLIAVLVAGPAAATTSGCPVPRPIVAGTNLETGHRFEVYAANDITWDCAKTLAGQLTYQGVPGHLATITSEGEDRFVDSLRKNALDDGLARPEVWVGGVQSDDKDVGEGWRWYNGEGAISTSQMPLPSYSNWLAGEPNDNTGAGSENHLAIGLRNEFGWNDEGALGNIGGYIVEYDVPRPAACEGQSCQTIQGHTLVFPKGSFEAGDSITFSAFEFTDPRISATDPDQRCGRAPLTLFDEATDPDDRFTELRIPPYLCGSPRFVVIAVDSSDFDVLNGTVFVENDTNVVLPDNLYNACEDPITTGGDPQFQDVVVWQSTDPELMLEDELGSAQFKGAAGEFTNECGSSRARVRDASYYVIGMHVDFGTGYELAANSAANHESFVALTRYKLSLLQESVKRAKTARALKNGDATKMGAQLTNAVRQLDRGNPAGALLHVRKFLKFVDAAEYEVVAPELFNFNGDHLMRGGNLEFTLRVKVIPYAP